MPKEYALDLKGIYKLLDEISSRVNAVRRLTMEAENPMFKVIGHAHTMGLASGHGKTHYSNEKFPESVGDFKEINEKYDSFGAVRGVTL